MTRLVVGKNLPPSGIDSKYLKVERTEMTTFWAEVTTPAVLHDLDAQEWRNSRFLKKTFTKPPTGRARKPQQTSRVFPFCLLVFGPAKASLHERLIVVNYWLNLTKKKQDNKWKEISRLFARPNKSAELLWQYDERNPRAVGIFDGAELRQTRAESSHSNQVLNGSKERKKRTQPPVTNAQLRDWVVKESEDQTQKQMLKMIKRSRPNENVQLDGYFEPSLLTVSTVYTPQKGQNGRPRTDTRRDPKLSIFGRDTVGVERQFDAIVESLKKTHSGSRVEDLSGKTIVDSVVASGAFVYVSEEASSWPGLERLASQKQQRIRSISLGSESEAADGYQGTVTDITGSFDSDSEDDYG